MAEPPARHQPDAGDAAVPTARSDCTRDRPDAAEGSPVPPTGTYATSDGYINISVVREKFFQGLCEVLALPDVGADPRFGSIEDRRTHVDALLPPIIEAVRGWGVEKLSAALVAADVPHAM